MLPALEGDIVLRDHSAQTFEQVVQNAARANQALQGTQSQLSRLEQVFAQLNVKTGSGGFLDALSGSKLSTDAVLQRVINSSNDLGGANYRELAGQVKQYAAELETAASATARLQQQQNQLSAKPLLPPTDITGLDRLQSRLASLKTDVGDLEKRSQQFYAALAQAMSAPAPSGGTFEQMNRGLEQANTSLKNTQAEATKLDGILARLNVRADQRGGLFDTLSGNALRVDDVLGRAAGVATAGSDEFKDLTNQLRLYVEATTKATEASAALGEKLGQAGEPGEQAFSKLGERMVKLKDDFANLEKGSDSFFKRATQQNQTAQGGGILGALKDATSGGNPFAGINPFGDSANIVQIASGIGAVVMGMRALKDVIPERNMQSFITTGVVGLPILAANILRITTGLSSISRGLTAMGSAMPEKILDTFFEKMGKDIPESAQGLIKLAMGFGSVKDAIPQTQMGGFLQNMLGALPGASARLMTVAGALGAVGAAALEVNNRMEQFLGFIYESEVRSNNMGFLGVRLNTDQIEQDIDKLQVLLDRRISEQDLATILLKVDPSAALSDVETFGQVAKTVQAYADEFGLDWTQALDQVVQAIGRGDGAWLQSQGYITNAQDAYNDYAKELGKTVPQLTNLEKQQALTNRVLDENATLLSEAATNAEIARGANERFTAQLADMKTGLADFISAWANNRMDGILNWFADDGSFGPGMASMEKFISDMAGNERIRAQLSDTAEANFDALLAERDRIAGQITDLTAELPAAQQSGDQQRVAWLTSNIEQLEGRMKAIDASVQVARDEVFVGKPVTPLPKAVDAQAIAAEANAQLTKVNTEYEERLTAARDELTNATLELQHAESVRVASLGGNENQKMVLATYEAELQRKQEALNQLDQDLASVRETLAKPPIIPVDMSQEEKRVDAITQQAGAVSAQLQQIETRVVQLNNASNAVQQISDLTNQIKQLQQAGGSEADVQKLIEQRAQSLQNFMAMADSLSKQGITIAAPDMPIEETVAAIDEQTTQAYAALKAYQDALVVLEKEIAASQERITQAPKTQVDQAAVQQAETELQALVAKRQQVQNEIARTQQLIGTMRSEIVGTPEAIQAEAAAKQAKMAQDAAQSRVELLEAEKSYFQSLAKVQEAAAVGIPAQWQQAQENVEAAQQRLHAAYQNFFSTNASDAAALVDAQKRLAEKLGEDFLQDLASGEMPTLEIFKMDDLSEQTLEALGEIKKIIVGDPIQIPLEISASGDKVAGAEEMVADAEQAVRQAMLALQAAYTRGNADTIAEAEANRDAAVAQAERAIATLEYAQAVEALSEARNSGIASTIAEAEADVTAAEAKYKSTEASVRSAQAKLVEISANEASGNSILGAAAKYELISRAASDASQSTAEHKQAMEGVAIQAGVLVDAASGLPLAFNAAEMNARQLDQALIDLETQMQNIESAAINAGFSIANRLIPVMGLSGSLQQAGQWAQQARGVRETFNQVNQNRMAEGQNPLGGEVLNASMDALRQSWNAMASDSVNAMRQVETATGGGADAMEQAVKRMDSALDGMIQGVLKDSTQGLIPLDNILPREDTVDEQARRMADVAVKGFKSPWYEGLQGLFPDDVLAQGEGKVKEHAARMVRDHQQGLTTIFYDTEMAAQKVLEQLDAKQNMGNFVAGVRERVKELGANVQDLDIMEALGIDVSDQKMAGAAQAAQKTMSEIVPSYEEIINQLSQLGEAESPIIDYLTPSEQGTETLKQAGIDTAATIGEHIVTQATEGAYGTRAIDAIINQMKAGEEKLKLAGRNAGDWWGSAMTGFVRSNVPSELLDILVSELIPLLIKQMAQQQERGATP